MSCPLGLESLIFKLPPFCLFVGFSLKRFEKNDILRIVRALAIFRPSLIALQMPLSLDDEVFVEKCFQRSLLVSIAQLFLGFDVYIISLGTRQTDFLQWNTNCRLASDRRNLSCSA